MAQVVVKVGNRLLESVLTRNSSEELKSKKGGREGSRQID
jgi:molybdopterin-binding protein